MLMPKAEFFKARFVGVVVMFAMATGVTMAQDATSAVNLDTDSTEAESLAYEFVHSADWKATANAHFDLTDSTLQKLAVPLGRPDSFRTAVELDQQPVTIRLEKHSIRSNDFQVLVQADASGQLTPVDPPPISTYYGFVDEMPNATVRASMIDGKLNAVIYTDSESYGIESISRAVPEADRDTYVVHRGSDLRNTNGNVCGVSERAFEAARLGIHSQPSAAGTGLDVTEIGIDADHSFFLENSSSVSNTVIDVERVMNGFTTGLTSAVADPYEVIGLTFEITTIIVRTDPADPYTSSDPDILLDQFRDTWRTSPESNIRRDVAHLFTGIDIDPPTIGIASVGTVCQSTNQFHYGLSESRWSPATLSRIAVTAHEIGHNFGAVHCNGNANCRIMCSGLGGCNGLSPFTFGPTASSQIASFRSGISCLAPLPLPLSLPFFDDFPASALNSNNWTYVDGVFAATTAVNPPSGTRAMNLDATGSVEFQDNESRTNFIDLGSVSEATATYFTQHRGVEAGESLIVDYWSVVGTQRRWLTINEIVSNGVDQTDFTFHSHILPSDALHDRFRLRFRANVDGANDEWFVDDVTVSTDVPPTILIQPSDVDACAGDLVTIEVTASGTEPLAYQWFKDGGPLIGEENSVLIFGSVALADAGDYTCQVSNNEGQILSDPATLTVLDGATCDDSLFCTGVESCSSGQCVSSGDPCTDPQFAICDETNDTCGATPRLFLVPAGTPPSMTVPGQTFDAVVAGGSTVVVEAFIESPVAEVLGYAVAIDCQSTSSDGGSPDVTYVPDSADVDSSRSDYAFNGLSNFPAIDPGQCDDNISCTSFADCPEGNSDCIDTNGDMVLDTCSVVEPRVGAVLLFDTDASPLPTASYLGQFELQIPNAASGEYIVEAVCKAGDGCPVNLTNIDDEGGLALPILSDALRLTVPVGRCCFDDGAPPLGCTETTAFDCTTTFSGAFAAGENCDGADPCACNTDCDCVIPFESGVSDGSDVCQYQSCGGGGCSEFPIRYGNVVEPFGGVVQTSDILCAVDAFGNYCLCPNADIAGCMVSGVPIATSDILAVVGAFGGADPCGCPMPPSAATGASVTVTAPVRYVGNGPDARIQLVANRRIVGSGDTVGVSVYAGGMDGVAGYEVALDATLASNNGKVIPLAITPAVDVSSKEFIFASGEHFPLVDDELDRLGAVAVGYQAVVGAKPAYLGTFEVEIPDGARGQIMISSRPGSLSLWRSSIEMVPVSEVEPIAVTVYSPRAGK